MRTDLSRWQWDSIKDNLDSTADDGEVGKWAADFMTTTNPIFSALVIVGYNDSIWIDRNNDGTRQPDELGAFKVAGCEGTDWKNNGFAWFSYGAVNDPEAGHTGIIGQALFLEAGSQDYTPLVTAEINLTTNNRQSIAIFKGVNWPQANTPDTADEGIGWSDLKISNRDPLFGHAGGSLSLQGHNISESGTIVVDLTDILKGGDFLFPRDWQEIGGPLSYCIGAYNPNNASYQINSIVFQLGSTGQRINAEIPDDTIGYNEMQWYCGVGVLNPDKAVPIPASGIWDLSLITDNVPAQTSLSQASPVHEWKFTPDETGTYIFSNDGLEDIEYYILNDARNVLYSGNKSTEFICIRGLRLL